MNELRTLGGISVNNIKNELENGPKIGTKNGLKIIDAS